MHVKLLNTIYCPFTDDNTTITINEVYEKASIKFKTTEDALKEKINANFNLLFL